MLEILLSISVSVLLLVWMLKMKKYNPFPKYTVVKLLIFGAIAVTVSGIVTLLGSLINLLVQIGPENLKLMTDAESAVKVVNEIVNTSKVITPEKALIGFFRTFIIIGLVEEVFKYLAARFAMKKEGVVNTWMDALLCMAIAAIGFQLIEDIGYSEGSIVIAIVRALTPYHFTFGVIMGYFYGLGKAKGNRLYSFLAILIPALIHTLYDFSINIVMQDEGFFGLTLGVNVFMFVLTVFMILKLRKWHKEGTLDISI